MGESLFAGSGSHNQDSHHAYSKRKRHYIQKMTSGEALRLISDPAYFFFCS